MSVRQKPEGTVVSHTELIVSWMIPVRKVDVVTGDQYQRLRECCDMLNLATMIANLAWLAQLVRAQQA